MPGTKPVPEEKDDDPQVEPTEPTDDLLPEDEPPLDQADEADDEGDAGEP